MTAQLLDGHVDALTAIVRHRTTDRHGRKSTAGHDHVGSML